MSPLPLRPWLAAAAAAALSLGAGGCDRDDAGAGATRGLLSAGSLPAEAPAGAMVLLGNGGDLSAWRSERGAGEPITWPCEGGVLTVAPGAGSLVTREPLGDFRLHLEFRIPDPPGAESGNSGVYLERRYELQLLDRDADVKARTACGAIYEFRAPDTDAAAAAGEWQRLDIVFRSARWRGGAKVESARVTAFLNGSLIHDDLRIPDKTGSGREESPAAQPLKLQEHGSRVQFRNIWVVPLQL